MRVTVKPGRIRVHYVDVILDTEDAKVFEIGLFSKYPEGVAWVDDPHSIEIRIFDGPDTAKIDESTEETTIARIHLDGDNKGWNLVTQLGKYSVQVILYHFSERRTLWEGKR